MKKIPFYLCLLVVTVFFVGPIAWMAFCALKPAVDLMSVPPPLLSGFTLENFKKVFFETDFFFRAKNSLAVTGLAVFIGIVLGLPAAYAIARYKKNFWSLVILMVRMIPGISFLVPWFILYRWLGILDSLYGLVASHLVLTLPLITWIMIGFFEDLPVEIEEAAKIDGCSDFGTFWKISVPLCRSGIATSAVLSFIFSWNHFLFALVLAGPRTNTLPVAVFQFITYEEIDFGGMFAAAALITAPVVLLVLFIQNQFVEGLTLGGVKG